MIHLALLALLAAAPAKDSPDSGLKTSPVTPKHPLLIDADKLYVQGKKQEAHWRGHVKVKRGPTNIVCDRLVAHYTEQQEVRRIRCYGNVEVLSEDKWAKGDQADFDNVTGILIVTGSPEAKQGANHVRGTKVTFSVDEDTIEVDNATALLKKPPEGTGAASDGKEKPSQTTKGKAADPKRDKAAR